MERGRQLVIRRDPSQGKSVSQSTKQRCSFVIQFSMEAMIQIQIHRKVCVTLMMHAYSMQEPACFDRFSTASSSKTETNVTCYSMAYGNPEFRKCRRLEFPKNLSFLSAPTTFKSFGRGHAEVFES